MSLGGVSFPMPGSPTLRRLHQTGLLICTLRAGVSFTVHSCYLAICFGLAFILLTLEGENVLM